MLRSTAILDTFFVDKLLVIPESELLVKSTVEILD